VSKEYNTDISYIRKKRRKTMNMHEQPQQTGWLQSKKTTWVLLGFIAIGAFFLFTEHTAHALGLLPYALFLLCPLMMIFMMHGGHGGHGDHGGPSDGQNQDQPPEGGKQ
jgi:hypothetical protein